MNSNDNGPENTAQMDDEQVPAPAKWLGGTGAIPFVSLAVAGPFLDETLRAQAAFGLAAYGAVILSFLGGVQWGLALGQPNAEDLARRLTVSIMPSLVAWGALFLPREAGLLVLAAAFVMVLFVDLKAVGTGVGPKWYAKLRWPLTMTVAASLVIGAVL